jgi:hypothetical protein
VLVAGVVLLGAAGCGVTTRVGAGRTLQIALSEYRVIPQDVRAAAGVLTILVHGRYQMASSILSDQALGAYGTLDVRSKTRGQ